MIVKTARTTLRIAFFLILSAHITKAQSGGSLQKVDDVSKPKLDWTYQYQFTNADSTEGIEKAFNREGKIVAETFFKDKGEFQFVKRFSTKTGNLIKSDTIVNFKKIVGSSMSYFASGKLKEVEHRDTSGTIDQYKGYFESGQRKVVINYKNGKRNGMMTEYNPNGTVKETGNYLNDKREGQFKFYDVRGNLLASRKFKADKIVK